MTETAPKGPGRPKGSLNKDKLEAKRKLEALGCDPLEGMARIGMEALEDSRAEESKLIELLKTEDVSPEHVDRVIDGFIARRNEHRETAGKMFKECAQYVHAKLKSVEVSVDPDSGPLFSINGLTLPNEQLRADTETTTGA